MRPPGIVAAEIAADRGAGVGDRIIGVEVNFLVFHRSPEPLDEDVVAPGAAVYAVPKPASLLVLGLGVAGIAVVRRSAR